MPQISSDDFQRNIHIFRSNYLKKLRSSTLTSEDLTFPPRAFNTENIEFNLDQISQILNMIDIIFMETGNIITFRLGQTQIMNRTLLLLLNKQDGKCQLEFNYLLTQDNFDELNNVAPKTKVINHVASDSTKNLKYSLGNHLFFLSSSHSKPKALELLLSHHKHGVDDREILVQQFKAFGTLCTQQSNAHAKYLFEKNISLKTIKEANQPLSSERQEYLEIGQKIQNAVEDKQFDLLICIINDFFAFKLSSLEKEKSKYFMLLNKEPFNEYLKLLPKLIINETEKVHETLDYIQHNIISYPLQLTRKIFNATSLNARIQDSIGPIMMTSTIDWRTALFYFYLTIYSYIQEDIPLPSYCFNMPSFAFNELLALQKQSKIINPDEILESFEHLEKQFGPIYESLLNFSESVTKFLIENSIQEHHTLLDGFIDLIKSPGAVSFLCNGLREKGENELAKYIEIITEEIHQYHSEYDVQDLLEEMISMSTDHNSNISTTLV